MEGIFQGRSDLGFRAGHHAPRFAVSIIFHSMVATINFGISLFYAGISIHHNQKCVLYWTMSPPLFNINHSLMCGVNHACSFSYPFRINTFLGGKGEHVLIGLVYFMILMILTRVFSAGLV